MAGKQIARELLQQHANPAKISQEVVKILTDDEYRSNMIAEMRRVKDKLIADITDDLGQLVISCLNRDYTD